MHCATQHAWRESQILTAVKDRAAGGYLCSQSSKACGCAYRKRAGACCNCAETQLCEGRNPPREPTIFKDAAQPPAWTAEPASDHRDNNKDKNGTTLPP